MSNQLATEMSQFATDWEAASRIRTFTASARASRLTWGT
jgi:hypothetical protein